MSLLARNDTSNGSSAGSTFNTNPVCGGGCEKLPNPRWSRRRIRSGTAWGVGVPFEIVLKYDRLYIWEIPMSKIQNIELEIQKLTPSELANFRKWFHEFDAENWDRQIEEDARAGKLDALADEAIKEFKSGGCKEL